ncbi:MAG: hypothetical protein J6Y02_06430 [Pseudobutyrivibrio sp.]|nr:hypothetical protein [Pseudobutyrivibrio sp.]
MKIAKLFISCPMRDLDDDYIKEMRDWMYNLACLLWGDEVDDFDIIETLIPPEESWKKNPSVKCIARSINKLADADYYIGIRDYDVTAHYSGCYIENFIVGTKMRDLKVHLIDDIKQFPIFSKLLKAIETTERNMFATIGKVDD